MDKPKRRFGDRKDGTLIRDLDAMHLMMSNLYLNRTDCEAYISEEINLEPIKRWIEAHNPEAGDFPYTFFHLIVTALLRALTLRPKMNRFITNKDYYQRNFLTAAFVVKRKFADDGKEGLAVIEAEPTSTVFDIHEKIRLAVTANRKGDDTTTEKGMEFFTKIPRFLAKWILSVIRFLDRHGKLPLSLVQGDGNYQSVFISNLGSIKLRCGYHHLTNWGTNSFFVVVGEKKTRPHYDEDGNMTMRETLNLGLTVDERIADGYYYAKSVRLLKHLLEHPELLEQPMTEEVEY